MSNVTKLPICKGCEREAVEVYDLSNNLSYFCHYCRERVVSEKEIQEWFESGPIKEETLSVWLDIINRSKNG
jgi:hypothetical protein